MKPNNSPSNQVLPFIHGGSNKEREFKDKNLKIYQMLFCIEYMKS